eukprot:m51a1_g5267 hypothetical protein (288) ;mRNA; f:130648-132077
MATTTAAVAAPRAGLVAFLWPEPVSPPQATVGCAPFVQKLYDLLSRDDLAHLIAWSDEHNREAFVVYAPAEFSTLVLPSHFDHCNFPSFALLWRRQLHLYGFRKVPSREGHCFAHPYFKASSPELMREIRRKKTPSSHHRRGAERSDSPYERPAAPATASARRGGAEHSNSPCERAPAAPVKREATNTPPPAPTQAVQQQQQQLEGVVPSEVQGREVLPYLLGVLQKLRSETEQNAEELRRINEEIEQSQRRVRELESAQSLNLLEQPLLQPASPAQSPGAGNLFFD